MSIWNLDSLYTGYESKEFINDFVLLKKQANKIQTFAINLTTPLSSDDIIKIIELRSSFDLVAKRISIYLALKSSADTSDSLTIKHQNKYQTIVSESSKYFSIIERAITTITNLQQLCCNPIINNHKYYLTQIINNKDHMLNEDVEEAISLMRLNASNSFKDMQRYLTSTLSVELNGESHTLSSIRNLAYDKDATLRKQAYYAELHAYDKIKESVAFSINSIKGEANIVSKLRNFDSVLDMTLNTSKMSKETLDAMFIAINKYLPKFHEYLRHKAKLLNHSDGLPWYDLFATLPCDDDQVFTIESSKRYLVDNFKKFSPDIANLINTAYDDNWIDFYPRKGKVGGAFCYNIPFLKQSRVLTNFDGSLSDVVTLAHELGHAYHGHCIQQHSILNTSYSMPVAETASTFNETIIMQAAINTAKSNKTKAMLIESMLQDVTQVICDITSRYNFETQVINRRKTDFLFSKDLEEIMIESQKVAYGDGLNHDILHPYMWINKSHYYTAGLNFYNFPYAFGCLFAKGLYAKYEKEGQPFVEKYNEILKATTICNVEDVAKIADIDLTKPQFWESSLQLMADYVDEFIKLTN